MTVITTDQPGVYVGDLDPGITFGRCFLNVSYASFDTPDDAGALPEKRAPKQCKLVLTPNLTGAVVLAPDAEIILVTPTSLTSGDGTFDFWCIDGMRSDVNPTGWNWTATLYVDKTRIGSFTFTPDSDDPTPTNLGQSFPLSDPATGEIILPGPQGDPGPAPDTVWLGDQLQVTGNNGAQLSPHLTGPRGADGTGGILLDTDGVPYFTPSAAGLVGTGSPLGAVTPPAAGVTYIDTAATNGARTWLSTGTTNTSWIVTYGDTGDRLITPTSGLFTSGSVIYRRIGSHVYLSLTDCILASGQGGAKTTISPLTTGWMPARNQNAWMLSGYATVRIMAATTGTFVLYGTSATTATTLNGIISYPTPNAWPTSLPGTAA